MRFLFSPPIVRRLGLDHNQALTISVESGKLLDLKQLHILKILMYRESPRSLQNSHSHDFILFSFQPSLTINRRVWIHLALVRRVRTFRTDGFAI